MKPTWLLTLTLCAFLLSGLFITPAHAANVTCLASPTSGPVGSVFTVTCTGFQPKLGTTAWVTEPDGAAWSVHGQVANSSGGVTYVLTSSAPGYASAASGTYHLTVQQGTLIGIASMTVTGGTEGVSGASLQASANSIGPGETVTVHGVGFLPGEIVTVWFDFPNGGCSLATLHLDNAFPDNVPLGADGLAFSPGMGTRFFGDFKADSAGAVGFSFAPPHFSDFSACLGTYHVVARGNASRLGGDTWVTFNGRAVSAGATLVASPNSVFAFRAQIGFAGSGYEPFEPVNCWVTTPQGAALAYYDLNTFLKADGGGRIAFSITTGSNIGNLGLIMTSEGALGEYAMSCKGASSGRIGIARYSVFGGMIDP